jgi:AICAR transformylase/IMP cyclohydrolase PurH
MASDAFFPADCVEIADNARRNKTVIQPGGSVRLSIDYCNENNLLNGIYWNKAFKH